MSSKYRLAVHYQHQIEPSDLQIEGNVMASNDPAVDREQEDWTHRQLAAGNDAAWCQAHVSAQMFLHTQGIAETYGGEGDAYLDGCSYESEEALWDSMLNDYDLEAEARVEAAEELQRQIAYNETNPIATRLQKVVVRLLKDLERSEALKRLMARQKRAYKMLETDSSPRSQEWAQHELVAIDEALEKL